MQMVRASDNVSAITSHSVGVPRVSYGCLRICSTVHSDPAWDLPKPRPASMRQMNQSPGGGICSGRAVHHHSPRAISFWAWADCAMIQARRSSAGRRLTRALRDMSTTSCYRHDRQRSQKILGLELDTPTYGWATVGPVSKSVNLTTPSSRPEMFPQANIPGRDARSSNPCSSSGSRVSRLGCALRLNWNSLPDCTESDRRRFWLLHRLYPQATAQDWSGPRWGALETAL